MPASRAQDFRAIDAPEAWLPEELAGVVKESKLTELPLYRLLSDAGVVIERLENELTAEIADPRSAQLLDTAIGAALIRVNRVAFVAGKLLHFLSILLSPSRSRVLIGQSWGTGIGYGPGDRTRRGPSHRLTPAHRAIRGTFSARTAGNTPQIARGTRL